MSTRDFCLLETETDVTNQLYKIKSLFFIENYLDIQYFVENFLSLISHTRFNRNLVS